MYPEQLCGFAGGESVESPLDKSLDAAFIDVRRHRNGGRGSSGLLSGWDAEWRRRRSLRRGGDAGGKQQDDPEITGRRGGLDRRRAGSW